MAFENISRILRVGSPANSLKLLLLAAARSRPRLRGACFALLRPLVRDGAVPLRYQVREETVGSTIRLADIDSDVMNTLELCARDWYQLDARFVPQVVVDGGGNIGLFTLKIAAEMHALHGAPSPRFLVYEPVAGNVIQIRRHFAMNGIHAEVHEACIGGLHRTLAFYVRDAIDSSFDPSKPYHTVLQVPVFTLDEALAGTDAERILIKLDIEGMEMETLESFLPDETRMVYLVGELHDYAKNVEKLEGMFRQQGWRCTLSAIADDHANFCALSPLAVALLNLPDANSV